MYICRLEVGPGGILHTTRASHPRRHKSRQTLLWLVKLWQAPAACCNMSPTSEHSACVGPHIFPSCLLAEIAICTLCSMPPIPYPSTLGKSERSCQKMHWMPRVAS